jgi:ABC-type Fe3+ transport system permease subunit
VILEILLLIVAIPVGLWIAWATKEELTQGRPWFRVLIIVSIIGVIGFWIYGFSWISWTFGFVGILSLISFVKSYKNREIYRPKI